MSAVENLIAVPPDGGWGWVIVGVAFYANVVIDVPVIGFQVMQPCLMAHLNKTAPEVSIIFSAYTTAMYAAGPVAGGVCNRFGFRATTILGSILMISGLASCYFVETFFSFLALYGMISGIGTSFIVMVASVSTGFWFESKRTIATGMTSSASGVSVFSIYLTAFVTENYGWRSCFIFWAGLLVILCAGSLLLAAPPMFELESKLPLVSDDEKELDISRITSIRPLDYEISKVREMAVTKVRKMTQLTGIPVGEYGGRPSAASMAKEVGVGRCCKCCLCCDWCQQTVGSRPLFRKDIFYEGNILHAAEVDHKEKETYTLSMIKLPTKKDVQEEVECSIGVPEAVTRAISDMIDFSLFESPVFLLIMLSSIFIFTVRYIPFLLIKRVNLVHMDEESATLLVLVMGMGSLICRASIGFVLCASKNISALTTIIILSLLGGIVLCCIPITYWFPYQVTMSFLGGALPSVIITLRSVLIIDYLGLSKLTSSTGVLFFIQSFAAFTGMPIAELLNNQTNTEYAAIVFSGVGYIIAGLHFLAIALLVHKKERSNRR